MSTDRSSLTEQQRLAVETRNVSVVLSSGAGCGKTHVLTQRYLSHLLDDGASPARIVAITFTERAARQMRGRIRKSLETHLRQADSDTEADRWATHLRELEGAPITTIHAFCATLLRQHAAEAGLDPRFEVLEEVLAINLRTETLIQTLQGLLVATTPVSDDLRQLILLYGWRGTMDGVEHLLRDADEGPRAEWLTRVPLDVARDWVDYATQTLLPRHLAFLLTTRPAIQRCLTLLRQHPPEPGPMAESAAILLEETPQLPGVRNLESAIERLTEAAKVGRQGKKAWPDPDVYGAIKSAFDDFRDELRKLTPEGFAAEPEDLLEAVETGRRFLRVTAEVGRTYRERKRRLGVADFQDLLMQARDLIRHSATVRARLQERYRHLLIDELQDTDPVQMELAQALCGEGLSGGKLFAVGDHKQSIYRFRGADVSLFQGLRQRVPATGRQQLTVNFRSQPAILSFVNALCGSALTDYEPLVPHQVQYNSGACIEFLWAIRPEDVSVSESRRIEAEQIARRIKGMIGRERLVLDEQTQQLREVRAGDVVLLFRAMSNVHLYEAALRQYGLDYYLVGGRAFFAQQEIYDLLNLLRTLENPEDAASLAGVLRSPFCCLSDEALYVLGRHRGGLWAALFAEQLEALLPDVQRDRLLRTRRNLTHWRDRKDRVPIAQLINDVLADSGYDAALQLEFLGERKLANLWKLREMARTFDRSGLFGLAEFIARLNDLTTTQPREEQAATQPESANVVRLMSIHQAKGLEFPVVFVPDMAATGGTNYQPAAVWDERLGCVARPIVEEGEQPFPDFAVRLRRAAEELEEWHEDLRVLYVACTRPRDYLVLSAALPVDYTASGPWMLTLADRFDLRTGFCKGEGPEVEVAGTLADPPEVRRVVTGMETPGLVPELVVRPGRRVRTLTELECREATLFPGESVSVERALRRVVERWDFADAAGWRQELDRLRLTREDRQEVESVLRRLAESEVVERLVRAKEVQRRVGVMGSGAAGEVDVVWRTSRGAWRLWNWDCGVGAGTRQGRMRERLPGLMVAAEALREWAGEEAKAVGVVFVREGVVVEKEIRS